MEVSLYSEIAKQLGFKSFAEMSSKWDYEGHLLFRQAVNRGFNRFHGAGQEHPDTVLEQAHLDTELE